MSTKKINTQSIVEYYEQNLKGVNWGTWPDSSNWPDVGIGYSISQYEGGYDIIKFESRIETDPGIQGKRFILSGQRPTAKTPVQVDGALSGSEQATPKRYLKAEMEIAGGKKLRDVVSEIGDTITLFEVHPDFADRENITNVTLRLVEKKPGGKRPNNKGWAEEKYVFEEESLTAPEKLNRQDYVK